MRGDIATKVNLIKENTDVNHNVPSSPQAALMNSVTFKIAYLVYIYLFQFACLDHHNYSSNLKH